MKDKKQTDKRVYPHCAADESKLGWPAGTRSVQYQNAARDVRGGEECLHNLTTGDRGVKYIPVFLHVSLVVFGFSHCTSVYKTVSTHQSCSSWLCISIPCCAYCVYAICLDVGLKSTRTLHQFDAARKEKSLLYRQSLISALMLYAQRP